MKLFGHAKRVGSEQRTTELVFECGGVPVARVQSSCISKFNITRGTTGASLLTMVLKDNALSGILGLPSEGSIAVWTDTADSAPVMMGRFQIDFFSGDFDEEEAQLEIHGRGPLAAAIDSRWNCALTGDLSQIIGQELAVHCQTEIRGVPGREVSLYVNAPSMYGALRLLTISTDCVVMEEMEDENVTIRSTARVIEELRAQTPVVISSDDVLAGSVRRGTPVRKRTD